MLSRAHDAGPRLANAPATATRDGTRRTEEESMSAVAMDVEGTRAEGQGLRIEAEADGFGPILQYGSDSKVFPAVLLVWLCAFVGLGAYLAGLFVPQLGH
jgi:hypothetical protein